MSDIPHGKREWPDGEERVVDGAVVISGKSLRHPAFLPVNEIPKEVRAIMRNSDEDMIVLHHHADPEVEVFVDRREIIALDARFAKVYNDA